MKSIIRRYQFFSLFSVGILLVLGLLVGLDRRPELAVAQEEKKSAAAPAPETKQPPRIEVAPPPADVNDLAMEVDALRTMYLFQFGRVNGQGYEGIRLIAKQTPTKAQKREAANASENYVKALTELREAFITGQEDNINDLSEQLEELAKDEQPDIDDANEITELARKNGPRLLGYLRPEVMVRYLSSYGKEFPAPFRLMYKTMRLNGKGKKPSPEEWKATCDAVIKEVSWQLGGLDPKEQKKIGDEAKKLLDKAYTLSNEQLRVNGMSGEQLKAAGLSGGNVLRAELGKFCSHASPTDPLKHVLEQDLAELLSNPRLLSAIEAREDYLKRKRQQVKDASKQ